MGVGSYTNAALVNELAEISAGKPFPFRPRRALCVTTMKTAQPKNDPMPAFLDRIESARATVTAIQTHLDEHLGVDPDRVNWANVGDAGWLLEQLTQACEHLGITPRA